MLLLTRRQGENIVIGTDIVLRVLSVKEHTGEVSLQVEAAAGVMARFEAGRVEKEKPTGPVVTHKRRWRALVPKG